MVVPVYPSRVFLQIKYNETCFAFWTEMFKAWKFGMEFF